MKDFIIRTRQESIKSLEFVYFLQEVVIPYVNKYEKSDNSLILDFVKLVNGFYLWEYKKINGYIQALTDSVFWESRKFYRELMNKFIAEKLTAKEFSKELYNQLIIDKEKAKSLHKNFSKQADIKLDRHSFQFSNIILNLELTLEAYKYKTTDSLFDGPIPNTELSFTTSSLRKEVQIALVEVNSYFTAGKFG